MHKIKNPDKNRDFKEVSNRALFLLLVALFKLVNTSGSINEHCFTRIKGVRRVRNFDFDYWVLIAVLPYDRLAGRSARARQKSVLVGHVFEDNEAIVFWMNLLLHGQVVAWILPCICFE